MASIHAIPRNQQCEHLQFNKHFQTKKKSSGKLIQFLQRIWIFIIRSEDLHVCWIFSPNEFDFNKLFWTFLFSTLSPLTMRFLSRRTTASQTNETTKTTKERKKAKRTSDIYRRNSGRQTDPLCPLIIPLILMFENLVMVSHGFWVETHIRLTNQAAFLILSPNQKVTL